MYRLIALLFVSQGVAAYGSVGHYVIGEAVQRVLPRTVLQRVADCGLLDPFGGSLGRASIWADRVKGLPDYQWTRPLHYVNAVPNPPHSCPEVVRADFISDELNILTMLHNLTAQVPSLGCPSPFEFNMLVHLIQDLHQPLHLTARDRGGTRRHFDLRGRTQNLHSFWDTTALNLLMKEDLRTDLSGAVRFFAREASMGRPKVPFEPVESFVTWTNEVAKSNCDLVWYYADPDYVRDSKMRVAALIVKAIERLAQTLTAVFDSRVPVLRLQQH